MIRRLPPLAGLVLLCLGVLTCDLTNCDDESERFTLADEQAIQIDSTAQQSLLATTIPGDQLVATYTFIGAQCDHIADDEVRFRVLFEIDPTVDAFAYQDAELAMHHTVWERDCFCANLGFQRVERGAISGERITSELWDIRADILVANEFGGDDIALTFAGVFVLHP